MTLAVERSALVLVDYQARLLPALADTATVLQHAVFLATLARALGVPVLGTEENPEHLGRNDPRVRELCDETLPKSCFDACGDGLLERLRVHRPDLAQVVVAGCEAHVCLLQTALGLLERGCAVFVVPQACGSRRREDKALALERLAQAGAVLASGETVAFEWLRSCHHPRFEDVLALVKAMPV
jgi:nicotinamidase-related amidase